MSSYIKTELMNDKLHTEISRVDTNLVKAICNSQCDSGSKMNICDQRYIVTAQKIVDHYLTIDFRLQLIVTITFNNPDLLFLHKRILDFKTCICFFLALDCYPDNICSFVRYSHYLLTDWELVQ